MGRIVKAPGAADRKAVDGCLNAPASDPVAAEVTEVLLGARLAAAAERASAKEAAILLARKMAEKIVGHVVEVNPAVMADIVGQALQAIRTRGASVVLRVHPEDLVSVEGSCAHWLAVDGAAAIHMVADASVGRYGCIVETPTGRVDGRLATQLDVLQRVIGGTVSHR